MAIFLAAMVGAGCGIRMDCHSHPFADVTVPVAALQEPADAGSADGGVQDLVDACQNQTGGSACLALCELAVGPENRPYIRTCELTTADGGVAVHVITSGFCAV